MPHLFFDDRTFRPFECELEADFEAAVVDHCNHIFGAETVYFDIKRRLGNQNVRQGSRSALKGTAEKRVRRKGHGVICDYSLAAVQLNHTRL